MRTEECLDMTLSPLVLPSVILRWKNDRCRVETPFCQVAICSAHHRASSPRAAGRQKAVDAIIGARLQPEQQRAQHCLANVRRQGGHVATRIHKDFIDGWKRPHGHTAYKDLRSSLGMNWQKAKVLLFLRTGRVTFKHHPTIWGAPKIGVPLNHQF